MRGSSACGTEPRHRPLAEQPPGSRGSHATKGRDGGPRRGVAVLSQYSAVLQIYDSVCHFCSHTRWSTQTDRLRTRPRCLRSSYHARGASKSHARLMLHAAGKGFYFTASMPLKLRGDPPRFPSRWHSFVRSAPYLSRVLHETVEYETVLLHVQHGSLRQTVREERSMPEEPWGRLMTRLRPAKCQGS
jgi:hypothetical protein